MAQTKQTAQKDTGGKPLAMGRGRGKATPKKNPMSGGRADRKVVLEYSSDETPDENALQPAEGAEAPKCVKKQIHLTCQRAQHTSVLLKPSPPSSSTMA